MKVRIDESRNNGSALKIDHARARPGCLPDLSRGSESLYPAALYGESLSNGEAIINGEDLSIHKDRVGRLRQHREDQTKEDKGPANDRSHHITMVR